jgi:hypothetical protein
MMLSLLLALGFGWVFDLPWWATSLWVLWTGATVYFHYKEETR